MAHTHSLWSSPVDGSSANERGSPRYVTKRNRLHASICWALYWFSRKHHAFQIRPVNGGNVSRSHDVRFKRLYEGVSQALKLAKRLGSDLLLRILLDHSDHRSCIMVEAIHFRSSNPAEVIVFVGEIVFRYVVRRAGPSMR